MGLQYSLPFSPDEVGLAEAVFGMDNVSRFPEKGGATETVTPLL